MKSYICILLLLANFIVLGQSEKVYATKKGAIDGYDPVAYFVNQQPQKGSSDFEYSWNGAKWYFASQENLNSFSKEPQKYTPQFGGYCAYAVSQGYTYAINPEAWKIVNGKLYLNYSKSIQKKWESNQADLIKQAELNWPKLIE